MILKWLDFELLPVNTETTLVKHALADLLPNFDWTLGGLSTLMRQLILVHYFQENCHPPCATQHGFRGLENSNHQNSSSSIDS